MSASVDGHPVVAREELRVLPQFTGALYAGEEDAVADRERLQRAPGLRQQPGQHALERRVRECRREPSLAQRCEPRAPVDLRQRRIVRPVGQSEPQQRRHRALADARDVDADGHVAVCAGGDARQAYAGHDLGGRRACTARARWVHAGHGDVAGCVHERPHHRLLCGDVEMLARAACAPCVQRNECVCRSLHAGMQRRLRKAHRHRWPVAIALQAEQPARSLEREVARRRAGLRARAAEGRDAHVHEVRMPCAYLRRRQLQFACDVRREALDEDVCLGEQRVQQLAIACPVEVAVQVERAAALAAADRGPVKRWAAGTGPFVRDRPRVTATATAIGPGEGRQCARIGAAWGFHLQHVRAEVCEHAAGEFRERACEIQHPHPCERTLRAMFHRSFPRHPAMPLGRVVRTAGRDCGGWHAGRQVRSCRPASVPCATSVSWATEARDRRHVWWRS